MGDAVNLHTEGGGGVGRRGTEGPPGWTETERLEPTGTTTLPLGPWQSCPVPSLVLMLLAPVGGSSPG